MIISGLECNPNKGRELYNHAVMGSFGIRDLM